MAPPSLVGRELDGRYRITRQLGEGGMGMVYEGLQVALDRKVAIKVLHARLADDDRFRERFIREARSASRIRHPNVVQIVDFGQTSDGLAYFVMEFLEGRDLRSLLNEVGRLPWPRARWLLLQAVRALRAAHGKGIIHRDIKPGNCFLFDSPDEGTVDNVKLLDFGIAKIDTEGHEGDPHAKSLTNTGEVFGTASYMAPEQARGQALDARSDVYSLGIMAYEMLVGAVPFTGTNPIHVIARHLTDAPRPLRELDPSIDSAVEALVLKAIAKEPEARFGSMAELEEALVAIPADLGASTVDLGLRPSDAPYLPVQTGSPRPPSIPATEVLDLGSQPSPSAPRAASSTVGSDDASGATSMTDGVPERTIVVASQPIVVTDASSSSSSSSHPQWATEVSDVRAAVLGTRPPPGEVDMATAPLQLDTSAGATADPRSHDSTFDRVAETHPHELSDVQRRGGAPRVGLLLGLLALLGGGGALAAVVLSADDRGGVATTASEARPPSPASMSDAPERPPEPMPTRDDRPSADVPPVATTRDVEQVVEPSAPPGASTPEPEPQVDARPEPTEAPATTAPSQTQKKPPPAPRKKTDAQVKNALEQAILRACGSVGAGTRVKVELTVGSDGAILLKSIHAEGAVEGCVAKQLGKAGFPAGGTRKVELEVQL